MTQQYVVGFNDGFFDNNDNENIGHFLFKTPRGGFLIHRGLSCRTARFLSVEDALQAVVDFSNQRFVISDVISHAEVRELYTNPHDGIDNTRAIPKLGERSYYFLSFMALSGYEPVNQFGNAVISIKGDINIQSIESSIAKTMTTCEEVVITSYQPITESVYDNNQDKAVFFMNEGVKLATGQTWQHNDKGYDVRIKHINRSGAVVVEEVETGQRDGFCREFFLAKFTIKK